MTITRDQAQRIISGNKGLIFGVTFVKRTTGEVREMVCRQRVRKFLAVNPTKPGLDFAAHKLIPVFDLDKMAYRSIAIEGITDVRINGKAYEVK